MKRTQIYLTQEQWSNLIKLGKVTRHSASELIRSAIDQMLGSQRKKVNLKEALSSSFGIWKDKGIKDSTDYVNKIRSGWQKRRDRLGL